MPRYEYSCPAHGEFEAVATVAGRNRVRCPACGAKPNRVFSPLRKGHVWDPGRHYNKALGRFIEDRTDYDRAMKETGAVHLYDIHGQKAVDSGELDFPDVYEPSANEHKETCRRVIRELRTKEFVDPKTRKPFHIDLTLDGERVR